MLDRVDMHIVHVRLEVSVIADGVFPITLLPKLIFTAVVFCLRLRVEDV